MHSTGWLPLLLSAAVYAVLSAAHPIAAVDGAMLGELAQAFDLSLWTVLPALLILVLPLCRVPVRWSMAASVAAAFLVTVAQQRMPALQALRAALEETFPKLRGKIRICSIGTIIASHSGPGTVAVFFLGDDRLPE